MKPKEETPLLTKEQSRPSKEKAAVPVSCAVLIVLLVTIGLVLHGAVDEDSSLPMDTQSHDVSQNTVFSVESHPGFPAHRQGHHVSVSYDGRSLMLNGVRALFLGGSMHPTRATPGTWEAALDQAVQNGLNLITIYVFWSAHQPIASRPFDWRFDDGGSIVVDNWELADAIHSCGKRGLFVHIRLGPYDCAEYSYGGIPLWLPRENMRMRRYDPLWLDAMENYVSTVCQYISSKRLWAPQGGPIIMAQIENELGDEMGDFMGAAGNVNKNVTDHASSTVQDYADWCGTIAEKYVPTGVALTMCNGLSANNTILTFNGDGGTEWLARQGDNGRIQVDQPALWTEDEGGFQVWGEDATAPVDYFWGHTARQMSSEALRWFARGGTHLNYYMWWGGYNRGRVAAAGIMNAYANDAVLCPSGQRHQPKFDLFTSLHSAIIQIASLLLNSPSAILEDQPVEVLQRGENGTDIWRRSDNHQAFVYRDEGSEVVFVESSTDLPTVVRITFPEGGQMILHVRPYAAMLLLDEKLLFDSSLIDSHAMSYTRRNRTLSPGLFDWAVWREPTGTAEAQSDAIVADLPVEQTELGAKLSVSSDYAWYETTFELARYSQSLVLQIATQKANGFVVFVDNCFAGIADNHEHGEGDITLNISLTRALDKGLHSIAVLSESFGYHNLIGRWAANTGPKTKGITGNVQLLDLGKSINLSDGRLWSSSAGLNGEKNYLSHDRLGRPETKNVFEANNLPTWWSASFETPEYIDEAQLFLRIVSGRGHVWLNGKDLGRFWNITRADSHELSMPFYLLPRDYLLPTGKINELVFFDALGSDMTISQLMFSGVFKSPAQHLQDEVDYPGSCI